MEIILSGITKEGRVVAYFASETRRLQVIKSEDRAGRNIEPRKSASRCCLFTSNSRIPTVAEIRISDKFPSFGAFIHGDVVDTFISWQSSTDTRPAQYLAGKVDSSRMVSLLQ